MNDTTDLSGRDQLMRYAADLSRVYRSHRTRETELRRLRSLLDCMLETTDDAVLLLDRSLRVLDANDAFCRMVGIRREHLQGIRISSNKRLKELRRWLEAGMLSEDRTATFDLELTDPPLRLRARVSPLRQADKTLGWLWSFRNQQTGQSLTAAEVMATLSHQIRSPLTSVVGFADMLDEKLSRAAQDDGTADIVRGLVEAANELRDVLEEVLTYESIGEREPGEWIDLAAVLAEASEHVRPQAARANVAVSISCPESPGAMVRGDQRLAGMALQQVIGNAIMHSPASGAVNVVLSIGQTAIEITVRDSGSGIPEEELQRVFEPFYRLPGASNSGPETLGIGLALARRIMDWHGGTVSAESSVGKGSSFVLRFPVAG